MHPLHTLVEQALATDIAQMVQEGHDLAALEAEVAAARRQGLGALVELQEELWSRPSPEGFPYVEPDSWPGIVEATGMPATEPGDNDRARPAAPASPDGTPDAAPRIDPDRLRDALHAAWLGRCVGCQAGKPLEGLSSPARIRELLTRVGSWPLEDYMNPIPADVEIVLDGGKVFFDASTDWRNGICRGNFDHVANDDDINYAIVSQLLLERHGTEFTSEQALTHFLEFMPRYGLWASGRSMFEKAAFGVSWEHTGVLGNPCRQSLGSQIRCDPFGWSAPGRPVLAARMAYRDAYNSQRRNGLYSGMFFAALLADVLAHGDVARAVETATSVVPPQSRFAEMLGFVRERCANDSDWEAVNGALHARYPEEAQSFNHAIPNAGIVVIALLSGGNDFTQTVGISVMAGLDTDCNGATAGSIMGAALGTAGIPGHWTEPFNDTIASHVRDHQSVTISSLAARMYEIATRPAGPR